MAKASVRWLSWIGVAGALGAATAAHADGEKPKTSSLSWVRLPGAESCIATQALSRAVEERLRRPVFVSPSNADLSVEGHVERAGKGFRAEVTVRDAQGTTLGKRELQSPGAACAGLDEPLSLAIALMIDPDADRPKAEVDAGSPPVAAPDAAPLAPAPATTVVIQREVVVEKPVVPPKKPGWLFDGTAGLAAGLGMLPTFSFGIAAQAILEPPKFWGLHGAVAGFGPSEVQTETGGSTVLGTVWLEGGLCPVHLHGKDLHFWSCGLAEIGFWTAQSRGVNRAEDTLRLLIGLGANARMSIHLIGPFVFRVGLTLSVPFARQVVAVRTNAGTSTEVLSPFFFNGYLDAGFGLHFD